jgi:hypothetical protein
MHNALDAKTLFTARGVQAAQSDRGPTRTFVGIGRRHNRVEQIARLNDLTPATGERHNELNMSTIDR